MQVNGKVRGRVVVAADRRGSPPFDRRKVQAFLAGATPRKVIVVAGRLVNHLGHVSAVPTVGR